MAFTLDLIKPGDGEATRYSLEDGSYIDAYNRFYDQL